MKAANIVSPSGFARVGAIRWYDADAQIQASLWSYIPTNKSIMKYRVRCISCAEDIVNNNVRISLLEMFRKHNARLRRLKRELG